MAPDSKIKYKILKATDIGELEGQSTTLITEGWQFAGPILYVDSLKTFFHEMLWFPQPVGPMPEPNRTEVKFNKAFAEMDTKIKDLLEINGIQLICQNEQLFTMYENKLTEGISANGVLTLLKNSKHCPTDLDDQLVIKEIEKLL